MKLSGLGRFRDLGLLAIRIGLGASLVAHGYPKLAGGPAAWEQIGGAMGLLAVPGPPRFWGLAAALAEFGGGILVVLGFFFRPAVLLLAVTMMVALNMHLKQGDPFRTYSHALDMAVVFLGFLFVGPGRLSIDRD
jgi:putative oxidoreductase